MPTGYTCIIEEKEGVTFRDYALRCARAFCGHQREESLDVMPEPRKLSPYHLTEMKKAEVEGTDGALAIGERLSRGA